MQVKRARTPDGWVFTLDAPNGRWRITLGGGRVALGHFQDAGVPYPSGVQRFWLLGLGVWPPMLRCMHGFLKLENADYTEGSGV